jgi:hypothetical protein
MQSQYPTQTVRPADLCLQSRPNTASGSLFFVVNNLHIAFVPFHIRPETEQDCKQADYMAANGHHAELNKDVSLKRIKSEKLPLVSTYGPNL